MIILILLGFPKFYLSSLDKNIPQTFKFSDSEKFNVGWAKSFFCPPLFQLKRWAKKTAHPTRKILILLSTANVRIRFICALVLKPIQS